MARMKVREVLEYEGITYPEGTKAVDNDAAMEQIEEWVNASTVPPCCDECGEVEPDGRCEHGYPSVLLALGLL